MDEFNTLSEEFNLPKAEYNEDYRTDFVKTVRDGAKQREVENKIKTKKRKRFMLQYLTASVVSVAVLSAAMEPPGEIHYVTCDRCSGTGIYCQGDPNFGFDRGNGAGYEGCHGTGYSLCPDIWCDNGQRRCDSCMGTGIDIHGHTCSDCNGTGYGICEMCNGTGIAACISADSHKKCVKCNGTGEIEEE